VTGGTATDAATSGQWLIYSNHHQMWFGPNGAGYRSHIGFAGRYDLADTAQWLTRGCHCCTVPEVAVPAPTLDLLNDPDALMTYEWRAPREASELAKREGRVNRCHPHAAHFLSREVTS
jgi:hypothetical protein